MNQAGEQTQSTKLEVKQPAKKPHSITQIVEKTNEVHLVTKKPAPRNVLSITDHNGRLIMGLQRW